MTPEAKAKRIVEHLQGCQNGWHYAEHVIAQAIRDAEDGALEKAKTFIRSMADEHRKGSDLWAALHVAAHGVGNIVTPTASNKD